MADNADQNSKGETAFDPNIQTEKIAFAADQLISCDCGRKNPPNRLKCMYCGAALAVEIDGTAVVRTHLRKLEEWERGYNIVTLAAAGDLNLPAIAALVSLEADVAEEMITANVPLPLARVESVDEANVVRGGLQKAGVETVVVSDLDLDIDKPPMRLNWIGLTDKGLSVRAFNTGDVTDIDRNDPILLVTGILAVSRTDAVEKNSRRKGKQVLDETSATAAEAVLDIYTSSTPLGFRVNLAGFDFSCLGSDKGLLAGENLNRLVRKLTDHMPTAKLVDDYPSMRQALGHVWEVESRRDVKAVQRAGLGSFGFASVSSTSNLSQFTRYSRLQRHLYEAQK